MPSARAPGTRAGLTTTQVIAAARRRLTSDGLDALTMRALASDLDVSPNTLYSHVASKSALVDALLDDVLADVRSPPVEAADAVGGLYDLLWSTHQVLLVHPEVVPLYLTGRGTRGPNARHLGDVMLALLARIGIDGPPARDAQRVLIIHTIGFAAFAAGSPPSATADVTLTRDELADNFDSGLRWLLTGIMSSR